jgi:hypothetical protein
MNRQLRHQIRSKSNSRKMDDRRLAALIFIACIKTRTLPAIGSPCHLKLVEITQ